jgi:hypothetical protein
MSLRRQPHITDAVAVPYRSTACRIGTHPTCVESAPVSAPVDLPVVYEVCDCPCHSTSDQSTCAEVRQ